MVNNLLLNLLLYSEAETILSGEQFHCVAANYA